MEVKRESAAILVANSQPRLMRALDDEVAQAKEIMKALHGHAGRARGSFKDFNGRSGWRGKIETAIDNIRFACQRFGSDIGC